MAMNGDKGMSDSGGHLAPIEAACLSALPGIRHGFFTREGGVSTGIYAALNCGLGSNDDREAVLENRARVCRHLGGQGDRVVTVHQHHSATAIFLDAAPDYESLPKADAIVTTTSGLVIGALAADCTPVLFADPEARVVAAAHAGWRGAVDGILEATVAEMERAGAERSRIRAAIGPTISQDAYEVGPEFEDRLNELDSGNARFFSKRNSNGRAHFDLPGFVIHRLQRARIATIDTATACTDRNDSRFFSYRRSRRRGEPDYGRQISAIVVA